MGCILKGLGLALLAFIALAVLLNDGNDHPRVVEEAVVPNQPGITKTELDQTKLADAAEKMAYLLSDFHPAAKTLFTYVDIESTDGRLLIVLGDFYASMNEQKRLELENNLLTIWHDTRYVREDGFSKKITLIQRVSSDPKDAIVRTIDTIR